MIEQILPTYAIRHIQSSVRRIYIFIYDVRILSPSRDEENNIFYVRLLTKATTKGTTIPPMRENVEQTPRAIFLKVESLRNSVFVAYCLKRRKLLCCPSE